MREADAARAYFRNKPDGAGFAQDSGSAGRTGRQWPDPPAKEAFHGPAGEFVRTIEPHTEASAVALLIQALVCFGSIIGRTAYFVAEASHHYMNLFTVLVGITSHGRKGSSWAQIFRFFRMLDGDWANSQIKSGLSSGEGLIDAVRDPIIKLQPVYKNKRVVDYQEVKVDAGIRDKRLMVFEKEFTSLLRVMARDGNILSATIRDGWETGDLRTMAKNSRTVATGAHISIVGHITPDELRSELGTTDMANGLANRFLWVCTTRSKELPEGGSAPEAALSRHEERFTEALDFARGVQEIKRDPSIKDMWAKAYHELTAAKPGLWGAVTSRAEAYTMRLACLYALLDKSPVVRAEHLMAAVALWEYCFASAQFIFGDALGDRTADVIYQRLRSAREGLDRTAISSLFSRHVPGAEITRALTLLQEHGLVICSKSGNSEGRPAEIWLPVGSTAKKAN